MSRLPSVPKFPFYLLGALTLVSFGGPFLVLVVVQGGQSALWPPDRAIEWIAIGAVCGLAVTLFTACVTIHLWYPVRRSSGTSAPKRPGPLSGPSAGPGPEDERGTSPRRNDP